MEMELFFSVLFYRRKLSGCQDLDLETFIMSLP